MEGPDTPQDALEAARGRVIVIEGELRSIVVVQLREDHHRFVGDDGRGWTDESGRWERIEPDVDAEHWGGT